MSTIDPDELAKVVPKPVADALLTLIATCGKHKVPMAALLKSPDMDRMLQLTAERDSLIASMAKATVTIIKQCKLITKYEAELGIDNEI